MLGKSPKGAVMADAVWAQYAIQDAFPKELGSVQQRQGTALGFFEEWAQERNITDWPNVRRVRALWNKDARRIVAHEKEALEAALKAKADDEARSLLQSLATVRHSLQAQDPDFHQLRIAAFVEVERTLAGLSGPGRAPQSTEEG